MRTPWAAGAAALLLILLSGCTSSGSSVRPSSTRTPLASPARTAVSAPIVSSLLATFQKAYGEGDWITVRDAFVNEATGQTLVNQMQNWKSEGVSDLRATLIYRQSIGGGAYIGTVQFASDPRAIPSYAIYIFRGSGSNVRIEREVTGLHGTSYQNLNWTVTRSRHFVVYHSPYQLRGVDRKPLQALEYERRQFIREFGVKVAPLTSYYLYPQQRLMSPFTGRACGATPQFIGCADPYTQPPSIHTSEWPSFHEPIHVYELALEPVVKPGQPVYEAPLFIGEGTAVALEDRQADPRLSDYCSDITYVPLDVCAQQAVGSVTPLSLLSDAGFNKADPGNAYLVGGSFVKYLILHYGFHRFGRFYYVLAAQPKDRQTDYDVAALQVYHLPIAQLLQEWRTALCRHGC